MEAGEHTAGGPSAVELAKVEGRYTVLARLASALWIAAIWFPFKAAQPIADSLAGEDTSVALSFSISLALAGVSTVTAIVALVRAARQKGELQRLRTRCNELESENQMLRGG